MKCLVLGSGRFKNMGSKVVSMSSKSGSGNAGHGAYVKKDLDIPEQEGAGKGAGIMKKKFIKPLKFKM